MTQRGACGLAEGKAMDWQEQEEVLTVLEEGTRA
jgi:hypothetical protein